MKGKSHDLPPREFFEREARARLTVGDLFAFPHPVIPIKTHGRWYGSLSQEALRRGAVLPQLALTEAKFVDPFLFVALWDDHSSYDDFTMHQCGATIMQVAGAGLRWEKLVLPILGGKEGLKYLWAVERGIFEMADVLDGMGFPVPEHIYVTDRTPT